MEVIFIALLMQTFILTEPKLEVDMAFNAKQFRQLIVKVLSPFPELSSQEAIQLLDGTCAKETLYGYYLKQVRGPGIGIMSVEPDTFNFLVGKYKKRYPFIADWKVEELEWDLRKSIFIARLKYLSIPERIPSSLAEQAAYWKKYYNTESGKGTVQEYLVTYNKYCLG